jgi:antibiotic biosynthesis monooxygenase (ABM) superfamily enzyme
VTVVRYSLLRIMLLFGCMLVLWLLGAWLPALRNPAWLLIATAVTSVTLSYFVLRGPRDELARQLAQQVEARTARRRSDAEIEDEELDRQLGEDPPAR